MIENRLKREGRGKEGGGRREKGDGLGKEGEERRGRRKLFHFESGEEVVV